MKENIFYCATCNKEMKSALLKSYALEEEVPLAHVPSYRCPQCHNFFFTEQQAKTMEQKTNQLKKSMVTQ